MRTALIFFLSAAMLSRAESPPTAPTIKELVSRLAISDEPAGMNPIYTPTKDTPKNDKRVIAHDAAKQLRERGVEAFPELLASLDDRRQSVAFRRVIPHTLGFACFCIIQDVVEDYPSAYYQAYPGWSRLGADAKPHERPNFLSSATIREWWRSRSARTLVQLRIEALDWTIEQERKIGFADEKQRTDFLVPLEKLRSQLAATQ